MQGDLSVEWGLENGLVQTIFAPCAEVLARRLGAAAPGQQLLDVGCGSGIVARLAAMSGWTGVGVDYNTSAIAVANAVAGFGTNWRFVEGNATVAGDLTKHGEFDAVVSQHLLQQKGFDPPAALRAMRACMRPGGRLLVSTWTPSLERCRAYDFIYTSVGKRDSYAGKEPATLAEMVGHAGFTVTYEGSSTPVTRPLEDPVTLVEQFLSGSHSGLKLSPEKRAEHLGAARELASGFAPRQDGLFELDMEIGVVEAIRPEAG